MIDNPSKWKDKYNVVSEQIQEESIEDNIKEYINQYIKQIDEGRRDNASYKALTRMFSNKEEKSENNFLYQGELISKIENSEKYSISTQDSFHGAPKFYDISLKSGGIERSGDDENLFKIYLNCERKNIARLVDEILKKLGKIENCRFEMKFLAENTESQEKTRYQRNDKIIIYTDSDIDKERIINSIIELKEEKQDLFTGDKKLPFIPKVKGFIGCTKEKVRSIYTPFSSNLFTETYNESISKIMEDCLLSSLIEVSKNDTMMSGYFSQVMINYLKLYKNMDSKQIEDVINTFKTKLQYYCEKSDIQIQGNNDKNQNDKEI